MRMKTSNQMENAEREENTEIIAHLYAMNMQRITGKHMHHHLSKGRAAAMLIKEMKKNVVEFTFNGQDGITHKVKGTLARYDRDFRKLYQINPNNRFIPYYNTKLKAWRTFQVTGLVAITCKSKL